MLVIQREIDSTILIRTPSGEQIEIDVVDIRGGRVRLGISAPDEFVIARGEIDDGRMTRSEVLAACRRKRP